MKKTKVLYVSQEISPFTEANEISEKSRSLPEKIQGIGHEIRTFMPRYGVINERRHQLHEVIRLSGMNLIIDNMDHPLIIKVASLQPARMQVYFIDNEDYFQRKAMFEDDKGKDFNDNDERAIFFCKGVLETVKKLGWSPDIIHCHGWMSSLIPLLVKTSYKDEPIFSNAKVVYSVYNNTFEKSLDKEFAKKAGIVEYVKDDDCGICSNPDFIALNNHAINWSDGVILGEKGVCDEIIEHVEASSKPTLNYQKTDECVKPYAAFYDSILDKEEKEVMVEK